MVRSTNNVVVVAGNLRHWGLKVTHVHLWHPLWVLNSKLASMFTTTLQAYLKLRGWLEYKGACIYKQTPQLALKGSYQEWPFSDFNSDLYKLHLHWNIVAAIWVESTKLWYFFVAIILTLLVTWNLQKLESYTSRPEYLAPSEAVQVLELEGVTHVWHEFTLSSMFQG